MPSRDPMGLLLSVIIMKSALVLTHAHAHAHAEGGILSESHLNITFEELSNSLEPEITIPKAQAVVTLFLRGQRSMRFQSTLRGTRWRARYTNTMQYYNITLYDYTHTITYNMTLYKLIQGSAPGCEHGCPRFDCKVLGFNPEHIDM